MSLKDRLALTRASTYSPSATDYFYEQLDSGFAKSGAWEKSSGNRDPHYQYYGSNFELFVSSGYDEAKSTLWFFAVNSRSVGAAYAFRPAAAILFHLHPLLMNRHIKTVELQGPRQVPIQDGIPNWPTIEFSAAEILEMRFMANAVVSANEVDGKRTALFSDVARAQFADEFLHRGAAKQAQAIVASLRV